MRDLGSSWIVDDSIPPEHNEITLIDIRSAEEFRVSKKAYERKLSLLSDIRDLVRSSDKYSLSDISGLSEKQKEELRILATNLLEIDLSFNPSETKARKDEALKKVDPVWIELAEGQIIINEGEKAERRHILILDTLREKNNRIFDLKIAFQFGLFIFTLIFLFYLVGRTNFRKFRLSMRDQWVIGAFFLTSLGIIAFLSHLFEAAKHQTIFGPSLIFLLPLAFAGMTLRLFTSMEITNFIVVIFSICVGWMHDSPFIALLTLTTSLAGASRMRHISQRFDVFKAGLIVGGVKALLAILGHGLHLMPSSGFQMEWANYATMISFSVFSGIFSASLVIGIQPLLELVGYTTDLRLMELSSTNHPLLKDLILKAPGTYFHSFTVSQLAEKAAEAIHANALFARVASLYHDIGKTKKPHYFIENIKGDNKHDKLAPTMSALIIANHVKDGIDLGIENQLPPSIIEVIPQHHGTMLISYFYDKAKKLADQNVAVDDRDFRYPGPKPQTREGAIIMLADAVEATAKSATTKTPDQMRQVVHQTIQRFFLDGQLDECELTLKDLNSIAQAFLQVLMGVYHQRIEYSHLKEGKDPLEERTTSQISVIKPLR
jgi:putative nucleotidyltransferase with HDIG domain